MNSTERLDVPSMSADIEEGPTRDPQSVSTNSPRMVESQELNVDYSTTKIKQEPKDIAQSITHIQIVAAS